MAKADATPFPAGSIGEELHRTPHYYKVWFSNGRERTAAVAVDTLRYPLRGTDVATYSRLFPYPEARKMNRLVIGRVFPTLKEALESEVD